MKWFRTACVAWGNNEIALSNIKIMCCVLLLLMAMERKRKGIKYKYFHGAFWLQQRDCISRNRIGFQIWSSFSVHCWNRSSQLLFLTKVVCTGWLDARGPVPNIIFLARYKFITLPWPLCHQKALPVLKNWRIDLFSNVASCLVCIYYQTWQ